ncbi:MAG: YcnI family protein [Acidimicrobiia bacterium]
MKRTILAAALAVTLGVVAVPAGAHVTVNPREATKGGYAKLAFRVPNERPEGTTKLEVNFPVEHPLSSVSVRPVAGWTYKVERQKLATPIGSEEPGEEAVTDYVSKITWEGGTIAPGEFQEFEVSGGPLPDDADQMVFKAVQTYASGEVVRWIEEAGDSGEEPEFPAPILTLVAGEDDHHATEPADAEDEAATTDDAATEEEQAGTTSNGDGGSSNNGLAVFALVVAGVALVIAGGGLLRRAKA